MRFENTQVYNIDGALRGMRNPLESWDKSDSYWSEEEIRLESMSGSLKYHIGENDLLLAHKLIKAGSEHRKFLRQIFISVDITAPIYWWKEFDTYKLGTVANSTSTMHKLASTPITMSCFEMDDYTNKEFGFFLKEFWLEQLIPTCEALRQMYLQTKDKAYWKELIRLLPESWLQTRTVTMNFENLLNMIRQRETHKLSEWRLSFVDWAFTVPYVQELLII